MSMNQPENNPREYEVLRRAPQDRFSPAASAAASLLGILAFLTVCGYGVIATYNGLTREPAAVARTDTEYERHHQNMPTVDVSDRQIQRLSIRVRHRDEHALLQHLHNHITAHGGTLVQTYRCGPDHDQPERNTPDPDGPSDGDIYRVNSGYEALTKDLTDPPWREPMTYARWALDPPTDPRLRYAEPDTYLSIDTEFLWFEDHRNKNTAIYATLAIAAMTTTLTILSVAAGAVRERRQRLYGRP